MRVVPVEQLMDNYAYLVVDERSGVAGVVDVAEADSVLAAAERERVRIAAILSTHHHFDHVGGNQALLQAAAPGSVEVYGYREDADRIPGMTRPLADGETFSLGTLTAQAIFIPAHTRGHLAYYFAADDAVFTGDTLFAGGCGRLFEGDAAQMMSSLSRLAALPDRTRVYCGHEYTQKNLEFAALLEPGNAALAERRREVARLREQGLPTVPSTIEIEKATNPFLRTHSQELRASVQARDAQAGDDPVSILAATRRLKDNW
ncbi:MAG TPA: hydroxyacylglutathione hydrolase [Candidatus Limnocylindrales bacterium]|nr:hydroxyacylglutathione hydrolase [Candidatus Limnocylindrales bacterium]